MLTIAHLTFKEALRKKILIAALILTLLFLVVYGLGLHFISQSVEEATARHNDVAAANGTDRFSAASMVEQMQRMLLVLGIYFASSIVSVLAVFSSVGSVSSEVENGMLHAILAKPIKRRSVILGKILGYAMMLVTYAALLFAAILGLNHYLTGIAIPGSIGSAIGLFVIQPLVLLTMTVAGSTRLSTLANGIAAFMVYTIGIIGGMMEQIGAMSEVPSLVSAGIVTSLLMPVDTIYRKIVVSVFGSPSNPMEWFTLGPFGAISEPSNAMVAYALLYIIGFAIIAVRSFSRRDIG